MADCCGSCGNTLVGKEKFKNDRFGLFIHWGLYALAARHEWVKSYERTSNEDYQKYFDLFDPDLYDPKAWARATKEAGMKYFCITTKHHEGFCLWDSKQTDYKATNTPYGKDLLTPMVEAFRNEGIGVGFYHSLIDWHHPDYAPDCFHPMQDNDEYKAKHKDADISRYADYLHAQVTELMTDFGEIEYIFFDFSYPHEKGGKGCNEWNSLRLLETCRTLQPNIVINDRLDLKDVEGGWDLETPEQVMLSKCPERDGKPIMWETCQTFSGSWGYHRDETSWKSLEQLLYLLIDTVSKDGNLLLNVGPTARGEFDYRAMDRLAGMGEWMKRQGRAIYGCGPAPEGFETPDDCRLTYNAKTNRLYVHMLNWPIGALHMDNMAGKFKYVQLLNDASEIRWREPEVQEYTGITKGGGEGSVTFLLPTLKPNVTVPVLELFLK